MKKNYATNDAAEMQFLFSFSRIGVYFLERKKQLTKRDLIAPEML